MLYSYYSKISLVHEIKKNTLKLDQTQQELEMLRKMCSKQEQSTVAKSKPKSLNKIAEEIKHEDQDSEEEKEGGSSTINSDYEDSPDKRNMLRRHQKRQPAGRKVRHWRNSNTPYKHYLEEAEYLGEENGFGYEYHQQAIEIPDPEKINKLQVKPTSQSKLKENSFRDILNAFSEEKDCLKILLRLNILEAKAQYLMSQDMNYINNFKTDGCISKENRSKILKSSQNPPTNTQPPPKLHHHNPLLNTSSSSLLQKEPTIKNFDATNSTLLKPQFQKNSLPNFSLQNPPNNLSSHAPPSTRTVNLFRKKKYQIEPTSGHLEYL
ncbi:unnamed protein product [Moneuplotes crassus]|uniref:Uncharacterized protein n=1 Tax=Euplotes crassus TaxID=5936 RepID=A0AAD1YAB4_EUPCR|nr:unnamed protein product [Moneuplotes crassus]